MENNVSGILEGAIDSIVKVMGDNCTIGNPIEAKNGTIIIPVSKVSVGFAGGGSDFGKKDSAKKNFGGAGGTGITATPVGFLVVTNEGKISFTSVDTSSNGITVDSIVEGISEIVEKIKTTFGKKDKGEEGEETQQDLPVEETKENE